MDINKLYLGDCLEIMQEIPDKSIDLILCDLPYGTTQNKWDIIIPFEPMWKQYKRIAKKNAAIVLFGSQPFSSALITSQLNMFRYSLCWFKNKSTGFLNAKRMPLRMHEDISIFYKYLPIYNPQKTTGHKPVNKFTKNTGDGSNYGKTKIGVSGGGSTERYPTSVLRFDVVNQDSKNRIHPTEKPLPLLEYLIKTYSNEGDLILDNAAGSGSTLIAAINTNRNFIGIEKDKDYFARSKERIDSHEKRTLCSRPSVGE